MRVVHRFAILFPTCLLIIEQRKAAVPLTCGLVCLFVSFICKQINRPLRCVCFVILFFTELNYRFKSFCFLFLFLINHTKQSSRYRLKSLLLQNSQSTCHQCTKKCFIAGHWGLACFDNFPGMEKGEFLG